MLKYCSRPFLSGGARKSDIYGWIGCSQSQTRMTAENGAGLTWDDFARIFNSDQWAPCISLYRTLIRLYLHRYHCTISFIAIGSKWKHGQSWAFWLRAAFSFHLIFWMPEAKARRTAWHHMPSFHFITALILRCIVPASSLFAVPRVPALQACAWCPLQACGAHRKLVVTMWCPLQSDGAHCKLEVPIANLWSQFGGHCKRPIVQEQSGWPGLRPNWSLMRYIWTCTSTYLQGL